MGISFVKNDRIESRRSLGLVSENTKIFKNIEGVCGIGHNRYSTTGTNCLENVQPIEMVSDNGIRYAFAFNGNIANYDELKEEYAKDYSFQTTNDAELLGLMLGKNLPNSIEETFQKLAQKIKGAYSVVMLTMEREPKVIALRDPFGFRPLCLGGNDDGFFIASESVAFSDCYIGARLLGDVRPGEIVTLTEKGLHRKLVFNLTRHAHCMFEYVYFARPDSVIEGMPVYNVREKLGVLLAGSSSVDADMVIPVPDSGRSAAAGFSMTSKIPLKEGFQKDRYRYKRSFILDKRKDRQEAVKKKLNPLTFIIEGKKVVVVDDSIVRGENARFVTDLKVSGAKEVHVRISCPPIMDWCPYGIDFYQGELIARKYIGLPHEEICKLVGKELRSDSFYYNTLENLIEAIGMTKEELCLACLTGEHPYEVKVKTKEERKR